jgi:hypothetical protein
MQFSPSCGMGEILKQSAQKLKATVGGQQAVAGGQ